MERAKRKVFEVHWIAYKCPSFISEKDGEQGWATVNADDYNDWIFYGPSDLDLEMAKHQAALANKYYGFDGEVKIVGRELAMQIRYQPYQWMQGAH